MLILEDEYTDFVMISSLVQQGALTWSSRSGLPNIHRAASLKEAQEVCDGVNLDVVICDLHLPDSNGIDTLQSMLTCTEAPLVVLTNADEQELAEEAVRSGAQDYLDKNALTTRRLWNSIRFAMERAALKQEWARLRSTKEEQRRLETIGRFAGGVAHDINNALNIISGFAQILEQHGAEQLPKALPQIRGASRRIADHVNRLVVIGNREEPNERVVRDLNTVVRGAHAQLARSLPPNIRLRLQLESGCAVESADVALYQILDHLVANAAEAMKGGGTVQIECRDAGDNIHLTVSDEGPGIPQQDLERVADPYFTTKGRKHCGLGLSVVAGLVRSSGGQLEIASSAAGTAVSCVFPKAATPRSTPTAPSSPGSSTPKEGPDGTAPMVLVADDEESIRRLLEIQLKHLGFSVTAAEDGEQGLALFLKNPDAFDLVVSDVLMPNMTGPEMVHHIKSHRPELPALFVTAYSGGLLKKQAWYHEGIPYLKKPFSLEEFRQVVEGLIPAR